VIRGRGACGKDGRRQDENGNREQAGEAHTIDLLHGFLSEKLMFRRARDTGERRLFPRRRIDRAQRATLH
jgi:hypothetical protein